jgi:hypothetical protein
MARNPIKQAYSQAKRIAHAIENPERFAEEMMLRQLPPLARQIYRDLRHPPSPEQLLKRYLRKLEKAAKRHVSRELKKLLTTRPRPRLPLPLPEPEPTSTFTPGTGKDRFIEVEGHTVRVVGLPDLSPPSEYESKPGLLAECEQAILEEIAEIVVEENLLADDEDELEEIE